MTEETKSSSGCLKFGIFGCLGVLAVALISSLALGALVFSGVRADDRWVENNSSFDDAVGSAASADSEKSGLATESQLADARTSTAIPTDQSLLASRSGTLELDLAGGSFVLEAYDGETIEVENDYDEGSHRFEQSTTVEDDGSEHTKITLQPRMRFNFEDNGRKRLTIRVPRDRPLALRGEVKQGESDLDIGGLAVREVDLELTMGDHRLSASEPTSGVMERMSIAGRMGAVRLSDIGNASPYGIEVTHRMGELRLDLEGSWRNDAAISMRCRMGQCTADVPLGVRAEVDASAFMGGRSVSVPDDEDLPADAPTLLLRARATMGEVQVR